MSELSQLAEKESKNTSTKTNALRGMWGRMRGM